jgi:hypothetical protein
LALAGLIDNIITATVRIDSSRKGFAIIGKEREGRINYESGIALAMETFKEAQATSDPQIILLAEYTFIKTLLKQRLDTLSAGQEGYGEMQKKALTK